MSKETMNAVRIHRFGGPEVLVYEQAPKPKLSDSVQVIHISRLESDL